MKRWSVRVVAALLAAAPLTLAEVMPAQAGLGVQLVSSSQWGPDAIGDMHVVGEVLNTGTAYADFVQIDLNFYNASGTLLATDFTFTTADVLAPNERSPFEDIFKPQPGYDHYSISINPSSTTAPPNHNFNVQVTNTFTDSIGDQHLVGTVTNNNSTADTFVEVIFAFYDCGHKTVDADFTFINQSPPTLGPSPASGSFELIRSSDAPAYVGAAVFAQSSDAPSPYAIPAPAIVATHPGPPTNVAASAGQGSAIVAWSPPPCDGGSPITSYTVTVSPGGTTTTAPGNANSVTVSPLASGTSFTFTVAATNATGAGPASAPSNAITPLPPVFPGQYAPLPPFRILDTRNGTGGFSMLGPAQSIDVQIAGVAQSGVPAMNSTTPPSAVVLNVTVTNPTAAGYLTLYPTGVSRPLASNLNFVPGQTVPNLVEVALGAGGKVTVYNSTGSSDVIFDVAGWVSTQGTVTGTAGLFRPLVPARILDTRSGLGGSHTLTAGQTITLQVTGAGSVPMTGVSGVVLNVTATGPTAASFLTVFPAGASQPLASNVNFTGGQTVPNRVTVKLGTGGSVSIFNAAGSVDVVVDVGGWFTDGSDATATGGLFTGLTPARILDTRNGTGGFNAAVGPNGTIKFQVAGQSGVPAMNATIAPKAVVLNVTVTNTTAASFLTVFPSDAATQPLASDLNWTAGKTVPNLVVVKLGADGKVAVYNGAGSTDVIADVVGWYS
jgi:hypothetical protein